MGGSIQAYQPTSFWRAITDLACCSNARASPNVVTPTSARRGSTLAHSSAVTNASPSAVCRSPNCMNDNVDTEVFSNLIRLKELRVEHRDLDDVISRLSLDPAVDQLRIKRLKKKKLQLKDTIAKLESELIPDLNA